MIQLRVLGPTELHGHDGEMLLSVLAQPKRLALLVYLVLNAKDGFTRRDKLLSLFWPESDSDRARASLRQSLSYLRKSLGDGVLVTRGDEEVGIVAGALECDAVHFEAALEAGADETAWDLYAGALLDGMHLSESGLERWIEDERSRLERQAVLTARALADQAEGRGDLDEAVAWARKALTLEPLSEICVRQLIRLLGGIGDREGAIRTYRSFKERLSKELQLEPAADTEALILTIRTGPGTAASSVAVGEPVGVRTVVSEHPRERTSHGRPRATRSLTVSVLALATMTLVAVFWGARRPAPLEPVLRSVVVMPDGEEMADIAGRRFVLSPDGARFVYVGGRDRRLWLRRRDQLNARALPGTEGAVSPFFSPEGGRVGFLSNGGLRIVSLGGGPIVEVTDAVDMWGGVTWGPDEMLYAASPGFGGLLRLSAEPGSVPQPFTTLASGQGETDHSWPDARPDEKSVVFTVDRARVGALGSDHSIAVADVETGVHRILFDGIFARHAGPDHLIYVTADSVLMVVPFDSETLETTGRPSVVSREQRVGFRRSVDVSVSTSGTLMYATGSMLVPSELLWVTRDGTVSPLDQRWRGDLLYPAISPDGARVALVARNGDVADVWIGDLSTGGRHQLTTEGGVNGYPSWTSDGLSATYFSRASGPADLWTKPADGNGRALLELHRPRDLAESHWSADGQWLIYRTTNVPPPSLTRPGAPGHGGGDILAVRPEVGGEPISLATTEFSELAPALSPDGRWLAYTSDESGRREIYVIPFPNPAGIRWAVTTDGGRSPLWSRATGELFYRDARLDMVAVEVETSPTFSLGRPTVLFSAGEYLADGLHPMYAVTPDGQRFLMIRREPRSPGQLVVVENWFQEFRDGAR